MSNQLYRPIVTLSRTVGGRGRPRQLGSNSSNLRVLSTPPVSTVTNFSSPTITIVNTNPNNKPTTELVPEPVSNHDRDLDEISDSPLMYDEGVENWENISEGSFGEISEADVECVSDASASRNCEFAVGYRPVAVRYLKSYKPSIFFKPKIYILGENRCLVSCVNMQLRQEDGSDTDEVICIDEDSVVSHDDESSAVVCEDVVTSNAADQLEQANPINDALVCKETEPIVAIDNKHEKDEAAPDITDSEKCGFTRGELMVQESINCSDGAILGLEYVVEVWETMESPSVFSNYLCLLCDDTLNKEILLTHLTSVRHSVTYLAKHFPSISHQFSEKESLSLDLKVELLALCMKIVSCNDKLLPFITTQSYLKDHNDDLKQAVLRAKHYEEASELCKQSDVTLPVEPVACAESESTQAVPEASEKPESEEVASKPDPESEAMQTDENGCAKKELKGEQEPIETVTAMSASPEASNIPSLATESRSDIVNVQILNRRRNLTRQLRLKSRKQNCPEGSSAVRTTFNSGNNVHCKVMNVHASTGTKESKHSESKNMNNTLAVGKDEETLMFTAAFSATKPNNNSDILNKSNDCEKGEKSLNRPVCEKFVMDFKGNKILLGNSTTKSSLRSVKSEKGVHSKKEFKKPPFPSDSKFSKSESKCMKTERHSSQQISRVSLNSESKNCGLHQNSDSGSQLTPQDVLKIDGQGSRSSLQSPQRTLHGSRGNFVHRSRSPLRSYPHSPYSRRLTSLSPRRSSRSPKRTVHSPRCSRSPKRTVRTLRCSRSPKRTIRTPRCSSRSPKPNTRSPRRSSRSPKPNTRSPRRSSRSPKRTLCSPRRSSHLKRGVRSPRRSSRSPKRTARSPRRSSRSPMRTARSPRRSSRSPMRTVRSPRHSSRSPKRTVRSPRRSSRSPKRTVRSPRRSSRSPKRTVRSPRRSSRSPRRSSRSPKQTVRNIRKSPDSPKRTFEHHTASLRSKIFGLGDKRKDSDFRKGLSFQRRHRSPISPAKVDKNSNQSKRDSRSRNKNDVHERRSNSLSRYQSRSLLRSRSRSRSPSRSRTYSSDVSPNSKITQHGSAQLNLKNPLNRVQDGANSIKQDPRVHGSVLDQSLFLQACVEPSPNSRNFLPTINHNFGLTQDPAIIRKLALQAQHQSLLMVPEGSMNLQRLAPPFVNTSQNRVQTPGNVLPHHPVRYPLASNAVTNVFPAPYFEDKAIPLHNRSSNYHNSKFTSSQTHLTPTSSYGFPMRTPEMQILNVPMTNQQQFSHQLAQNVFNVIDQSYHSSPLQKEKVFQDMRNRVSKIFGTGLSGKTPETNVGSYSFSQNNVPIPGIGDFESTANDDSLDNATKLFLAQTFDKIKNNLDASVFHSEEAIRSAILDVLPKELMKHGGSLSASSSNSPAPQQQVKVSEKLRQPKAIGHPPIPADTKVKFKDSSKVTNVTNLFPIMSQDPEARQSMDLNHSEQKLSLAQRLASVLIKLGMVDVPGPLLAEMLRTIGAFNSSMPLQDISEAQIISILKECGYVKCR